ncbi:unnamed protein product [Protopolystoma xenopodis]|uniref:Phospholipid/glycerol acyltransferase domain-containing protein n=1 Tax=Protopolystoma xenopodis TaxID=117903 RepID=A0A3S5AYR4_9PLAT|nr:unnamed protein product [Protopolystoma xenopodis]
MLRRFLLPLFIIFARAVFFFSSFHWVKFEGKRSPRCDAPILVVAPHSSFLDSLIVVLLGMNSVVGKLETAESITGCLVKMTQPILVSREDPKSRQNTIFEINRRCKSSDGWPQLVIFPEGTCTNRSCLIRFKTGAFIPGVPVQPAVLRWPNVIEIFYLYR